MELQWLQHYFCFSFFVSRWLNSKLKGKRLISCRNRYEESVLPGISPAVLSFPCVKVSSIACWKWGEDSNINGMPADGAEAF